MKREDNTMSFIQIYDTTLRDGTQSEGFNLSGYDKLRVARRLDDLGVAFIEGGWPGSNPVDVAFFKEIANYHLKYARIAAFGSTHHPDNKVEEDPNLNALIASGATAGTIFGKSCERHAKEALRLDPKRNLDIIRNSVAYLKRSMPEVYFDAEHFFDGYKRNAEYSLAVLRAAHEAGGRVIGIMPAFLRSRERLFDDVETIVVTSMHERKQLMYDQSDAFVVAPGGIGTLEEVVELLSWKRLDLHHKPVVFLNLNGFWDGFFALMRHSVDEGMTPPSFLDAWTVAETVEEAMAQVQAGGDAPQLKHDHR